MATPSTRFRGQAIITLLLISAIVIFANLLSNKVHSRVDFTEERIYTLADASKQLLAELDDTVQIRLFFSREMPSSWGRARDEVLDLVREIEAANPDRVDLTLYHPDVNPESQMDAASLGAEEIDVPYASESVRSISRIWFTGVFMYEDRKQILTFNVYNPNLEYDIVASIDKLSRREPVRIGIVQGQNELDYYRDLGNFRDEMERQYVPVKVSLREGNPVPANVQVLIIPGSKEIWTDRAMFELDQFMMRGGHVILLQGRYQLTPGQILEPTTSPMEKLFRHWGIGIEQAMVGETQRGSVQRMRVGNMMMEQRFPLVPEVHPDSLDPDHPVTAGVGAFTMMFPAPILVTSEIPEGVESTILARSSSGGFKISPDFLRLNLVKPTGTEELVLGPRTLAVLLKGKWPSAYAGSGEIPVPSPGGAQVGVPLPEDTNRQILADSADHTPSLLIIGDSNFVTSDPFNWTMVSRALEWMTTGPRLAGIQSKSFKPRPLKELTESQIRRWQIGILLGLPLIIALLGVMRYLARTAAARKGVED